MKRIIPLYEEFLNERMQGVRSSVIYSIAMTIIDKLGNAKDLSIAEIDKIANKVLSGAEMKVYIEEDEKDRIINSIEDNLKTKISEGSISDYLIEMMENIVNQLKKNLFPHVLPKKLQRKDLDKAAKKALSKDDYEMYIENAESLIDMLQDYENMTIK